jgi:hypothetical protein
MYDQDRIFDEAEWHDSYIWDVIRRRFQPSNRFFNLNVKQIQGRLSGHPFINSELGLYMDHAKGERKQHGHSRGRDIHHHNDHPYWASIRAGGT